MNSWLGTITMAHGEQVLFSVVGVIATLGFAWYNELTNSPRVTREERLFLVALESFLLCIQGFGATIAMWTAGSFLFGL